MGLDGLDIIYRIERTFEVEVSVDDFMGIVRDDDIQVGDLYQLILSKLGLREMARHNVGLNFALWRDMQHALHAATDVSIDETELGTPLETLFPRETRRARWDALAAAAPYHIRPLEYPRIVRVLGFWLAAAMATIELIPLWQLPGLRWLWLVLGLFGLWVFIETHAKMLKILTPWRNRFPHGAKTVKDLCRAVLATNYEAICRDAPVPLGDAQLPLDDRCVAVWQQLVEILTGVLAVDADQITFDARLVKDLGME